MNIFFSTWESLVWQPQINALYLLYKQSGDIGYSILALGVLANIPLFWLYSKTYINMQKTRMIAPQLQALQKIHKDDVLELRKQTVEFYRKHNINNSSMLYMMLFQIFFVTGLFYIIIELQKNKPVGGLYTWLTGGDQFLFPTKAFGGALDITANVNSQIWLLVISTSLSFAYGYYSTNISPQIKLPVSPDKTPEEIMQMEATEKMQIVMMLYAMPILQGVFNYNMPVGINIYAIAAAFFALTRQVVITKYYAKETEQLYKDIVESDPSSSNPNNDKDLSSQAIASVAQDSPVVEVVSKPVAKLQNKSQNHPKPNFQKKKKKR